MKFTLNWLKRFLDTEANLIEITTALTDIGLEVERIIDRTAELADFKIAEIIQAIPHPKSQKLQVCTVNDGSSILQIVCGAPNARAGIKVVLAPVNSVIPNGGFTIKESEIRGVNSNGMLCSEAELKIGSDEGKIIELPIEAIVGASFLKYCEFEDPIIDIAVTPNRSDCFGVYGIARDLAARDVGTLRPLNSIEIHPSYTPDITAKIVSSNCSLLMLREIRNVKNTKSPQWLQQLLKNIGQEPVSAIVDITNYVNLSFGRPLHAYDRAKVGSQLIAGSIEEAQEFYGLNNKSYKLLPEDLTIKDESNAMLAIAGIIGSYDSKCELDTTTIVLEAAVFDSITISKMGRKFNLITDARTRFERGIDHNFTRLGAEIATQMILEYCGGEASAYSIAGDISIPLRRIVFPLELFAQKIGLELPKARIVQILSELGFAIDEQENCLKLTIPSWRHDIKIVEDIIEEIIRIHGYDKIPMIPLPAILYDEGNFTSKLLTAAQRRDIELRRIIAACSYQEVVTWSFMDVKEAKSFSSHNPGLQLINPISRELNYMRPTIIPNLLTAVRNNASRSIFNIALFELGPVFRGVTPDQQENSLAAIICGEVKRRQHNSAAKLVDIYDVKGDLEFIITELGFDFSRLQLDYNNTPNYYHPGRSATLRLGKNTVGYIGELNPKILKLYDLKTIVCGFEIFISCIPYPRSKCGNRGDIKLSNYQVVNRDFAFVMNIEQPVGEILNFIPTIAPALIRNVHLFDVYIGERIEQNQKSVAISVALQAEHTFTDQELEQISNKIIGSVEQKFKVGIRK